MKRLNSVLLSLALLLGACASVEKTREERAAERQERETSRTVRELAREMQPNS